jgi:hypothetical protein
VLDHSLCIVLHTELYIPVPSQHPFQTALRRSSIRSDLFLSADGSLFRSALCFRSWAALRQVPSSRFGRWIKCSTRSQKGDRRVLLPQYCEGVPRRPPSQHNHRGLHLQPVLQYGLGRGENELPRRLGQAVRLASGRLGKVRL